MSFASPSRLVSIASKMASSSPFSQAVVCAMRKLYGSSLHIEWMVILKNTDIDFFCQDIQSQSLIKTGTILAVSILSSSILFIVHTEIPESLLIKMLNEMI